MEPPVDHQYCNFGKNTYILRIVSCTVAFQEFETLLGTELFILPAISSSTIHILSMGVSVLLKSRR